jgi:D-threo-aldose 1-dehydrogenase
VDPAAKKPLGKSGLEVTVASYGGGSLGNFYRRITNAEAVAVLDAAWDAGIRYFDTAPLYGRGRSERRLGAFLDEKPRDSYVLSTKVGRLMVPAKGNTEQDGIFFDPAPFNTEHDYSYGGIMRSFEHSLQRLGLDRIDIVYVHDIGPWFHGDKNAMYMHQFKEGRGLEALEELRRNGDIKAYGLGVNEVEACLDCLDYGHPDAFLLARRFTLLEHDTAKPLLDRCAQESVSIIVGGVFNSGILATGAVAGAHYNYAEATPEVLALVRRLEAVCERHGVQLSAAALQFPFIHPAVTSVLLGSGTVSSLQRNVEGLRATIPAEFWRELVQEGLLEAEWSPSNE